MRTLSRANPGRVASPARMVLSAMCASLLGIGLSRFAYTPLLPELVSSHWFSSSDAAYLGAANLAGYLAGALLARPLAARLTPVGAMRAMMALAALSFFACAFPVSFLWFFGWRVLSGVSGGVLMVLVAPTILPHIPESRRGLAGGMIFAGVGAGIALSGTLVPLLLQAGLVRTWLGLGVLAVALAALAWGGWPPAGPVAARRVRFVWPPRVLAIVCLLYGLNAVGLVPHMTLLVDFVARGLGQGIAAGAGYWVVFGLAAMAGPILAGHVADSIGFRRALRGAFLLQALAVALPVWSHGPLALTVSSLIVGAFVPGIVPLVLGRVRELTPGDADRQKAAWSLCTIGFALGQAAGAYGMSYLFALTGGAHLLIFGLGAAALAAAFLIEIATSRGD
ncbi:MAG: transporter [Rubritepida sp.]|nr:transporter [Rubritepida sp.]